MLAEIFMIWLESQRRQQTTPVPPSSTFVAFTPADLGSFKTGRRRR
jgi:hypothetical protein